MRDSNRPRKGLLFYSKTLSKLKVNESVQPIYNVDTLQ